MPQNCVLKVRKRADWQGGARAVSKNEKVRSWRFLPVAPTIAFLPFSPVQKADLERVLRVIFSHADKKGWFVMVRDSNNRHVGNKLWGDGWGWSWFEATDPSKTTSTDYKINCLYCHIPAKSSDWIYVGGYLYVPAIGKFRPALRSMASTVADFIE